MIHLPILRRGKPYKSIDILRVPHHRTREPFLELSQANTGLIRRDLLDQKRAKDALSAIPIKEMIEISRRAAEIFMNDTLPLGDAEQSADDYIAQLSATTGMPHALGRRNMNKIRGVMAEIEDVLAGLTRNLDLEIFDTGTTEFEKLSMSFYPRGDSLGVILPNNSPGVHSLWVPAIVMKTPLVLKPGSAEPWTPFRIAQAFIKAGCPEEAFSYYPAEHAGGSEILRHTGRGMMFGDASSVGIWKTDPRIELHGPGYSKVVIGEDCIDEWEKYLDVIVASIADNGGRSCINASGVWVPRHGSKIAEAIAERLAQIIPRNAEDPEARIAPFVDSGVAQRISTMIDQGLAEAGAREVTASFRDSGRLVEYDGCSYLLPTVVECESADHTLANREFLFPFASVIEVSQREMPVAFGPTLVVTAITNDQDFINRLTASPLVDRINIGPISTMQIAWNQPHEGNLFEHLYARRSYQRAYAAS